MKLPDQASPIQRDLNCDQSYRSKTVAVNANEIACSDRSGGVNASGYEDCFRLQGLAQQLCLQYY
jgi:hypothetical protein